MFKIITGTALTLLLSGPLTFESPATPLTAHEYKNPAQMNDFIRTEQCFIWLLKEKAQAPTAHILPHKPQHNPKDSRR